MCKKLKYHIFKDDVPTLKKKKIKVSERKKCIMVSEGKYCTRPQKKWLIGLQKYTCHLKNLLH